jgi:pimeloyl-ACP methyl ester carboxylesterase
MPLVFVHGVPETAAIWGPLVRQIDRHDVVLLSPPGFGAPVPGGLEPTSDAYADWLVGELERLDRPIDLVVTTGAAST